MTKAEGFGKNELFEILNTLLKGSDEMVVNARSRLQAEKGDSALDPWNMGFMLAGAVEEKLDPYFPFEKSLEMWGRSFAKMNIQYEGATMTLDVLERKGKYSNGFCHWYVRSSFVCWFFVFLKTKHAIQCNFFPR